MKDERGDPQSRESYGFSQTECRFQEPSHRSSVTRKDEELVWHSSHDNQERNRGQDSNRG